MTRTLLLSIDASELNSAPSQTSLATAAQILRVGGTVAFPTETVYGLGAHALNPDAVRKIFTAKQRPTWDPLIVHVVGTVMLEQVAASVHANERLLMKSFWPGPLTLLLARSAAVPELVTAGRPKVGVREPAHAVARALIEMAGMPIAAPSANSFGRISPTTARHVLEDLDGRVDAILDGGPTALGLESTVLDAGAEPPMLYRHGMVTLEALRDVLPGIIAFDESSVVGGTLPAALPSPGLGIRHYAPRAKLVLVELSDLAAALQATTVANAAAVSARSSTGVLLPDGLAVLVPEGVRVERWGSWERPEDLAQKLFAGLRNLDTVGVQTIYCPLPAADGLGAALRDRLKKAARV